MTPAAELLATEDMTLAEVEDLLGPEEPDGHDVSPPPVRRLARP